MSLLTVVPGALAGLVVSAADKAPKAEDVKAGWLAFAIFLALLAAVALLGWSLARQLRKAQAAEDAGLYDPSDRKPREVIPVDQPPASRAPAETAERPVEASEHPEPGVSGAGLPGELGEPGDGTPPRS